MSVCLLYLYLLHVQGSLRPSQEPVFNLVFLVKTSYLQMFCAFLCLCVSSWLCFYWKWMSCSIWCKAFVPTCPPSYCVPYVHVLHRLKYQLTFNLVSCLRSASLLGACVYAEALIVFAFSVVLSALSASAEALLQSGFHFTPLAVNSLCRSIITSRR